MYKLHAWYECDNSVRVYPIFLSLFSPSLMSPFSLALYCIYYILQVEILDSVCVYGGKISGTTLARLKLDSWICQ